MMERGLKLMILLVCSFMSLDKGGGFLAESSGEHGRKRVLGCKESSER
jgi:hypothetical protein